MERSFLSHREGKTMAKKIVDINGERMPTAHVTAPDPRVPMGNSGAIRSSSRRSTSSRKPFVGGRFRNSNRHRKL